jgi:hypothetical protein
VTIGQTCIPVTVAANGMTPSQFYTTLPDRSRPNDDRMMRGVKTGLRRALGLSVRLCVAFVGLTGANCRRHPPGTPANPGLTTTGRAPDAVRPASLADVNLSPITGGYQICSPRALHACSALAVTGLGAVKLPVTDIAAAGSCADQQARATQHCAGVGNPYDAPNLRCLARQGIWNTLLHDAPGPSASGEKQRLTLRCAEGETWIDLITPI